MKGDPSLRIELSRTSWLAGLACCFLWAASTVETAAQQPGPSQVLKGQGLKLSPPSTWLLTVEAAVLKDFRIAKGLAAQLRGAQDQQQALETGSLDPKAMMDAYQQQIDLMDQPITTIDEELAKLGPSDRKSTRLNSSHLARSRMPSSA